MTCSYCRARNDADAHRCVRCGRRTGDDEPRRFPVQHGAVAPQLDRAERPARAEAAATRQGPTLVTELPRALANSTSYGAPVQPSLWGPVVVDRTPAPKPARSTPRPPSVRQRPQQAQTAFDWPALEVSRSGNANVTHSVRCQAHVAATGHRMLAGAIDIAIPFLLFGALLSAAHVVAGRLALNEQTLPFYAASVALLTLLYRFIYCLGDADTPGMQFAQLRLVTLEGRRPGRGRRVRRMLSGWIAVASAGMGLIWALLDEERLAWHDHMSGTFPTPTREQQGEHC